MTENSGDRDKGGKAVRRRTAARLCAVQALYQAEMTGVPASRLIDEFVSHRLNDAAHSEGFGKPDKAFFKILVEGSSNEIPTTDEMISSVLMEGWTFDRLETIMRAILRAGAYELLSLSDVPSAVVISEYVDIAHCFFNEKEPGFVNGVLDRLAGVVREDEATDGNGGNIEQGNGSQ